MKRVQQPQSTTIEFEGERYVLLPLDTPVPGEHETAHYEVRTPDSVSVYESCDAKEAFCTAVVFSDLYDFVLLNIRRDRTLWQLRCDRDGMCSPDGAQVEFVVRAAEPAQSNPNQ